MRRLRRGAPPVPVPAWLWFSPTLKQFLSLRRPQSPVGTLGLESSGDSGGTGRASWSCAVGSAAMCCAHPHRALRVDVALTPARPGPAFLSLSPGAICLGAAVSDSTRCPPHTLLVEVPCHMPALSPAPGRWEMWPLAQTPRMGTKSPLSAGRWQPPLSPLPLCPYSVARPVWGHGAVICITQVRDRGDRAKQSCSGQEVVTAPGQSLQQGDPGMQHTCGCPHALPWDVSPFSTRYRVRGAARRGPQSVVTRGHLLLPSTRHCHAGPEHTHGADCRAGGRGSVASRDTKMCQQRQCAAQGQGAGEGQQHTADKGLVGGTAAQHGLSHWRWWTRGLRVRCVPRCMAEVAHTRARMQPACMYTHMPARAHT